MRLSRMYCGEIAHLHDLRRIVSIEPDVFDEPCGVTDAMGTTPLDGLPDALLAERFTGVDRDVEILPLDVVERVDVFLRRKPALLASEIEADDTALAKIDGQFGHLLRETHVAHRADDHPVLDAEGRFPALEAFQHRVDDVVPMEALVGVEHRRKAGLDVHDTIVVHVLHHFVRDALEGFLRLHHAAGVRKALEVHRQASSLGASMKPLSEIAAVGRGQCGVPLVARQFDCRLRAKAAVEVVVEQDFGQ